ncbi:hypothetical protein D9756_009635 [Leucocoprinus leucothites]|uniref:SHSP domain-containing protein n=1 Tax=Leucocoprinus leucothites TaxID=201217 RepID=A0A8H5FTW1_9AGAR|nr:hypothetical protein D9756_009635 [Leucoagaricus leucothites]
MSGYQATGTSSNPILGSPRPTSWRAWASTIIVFGTVKSSSSHFEPIRSEHSLYPMTFSTPHPTTLAASSGWTDPHKNNEASLVSASFELSGVKKEDTQLEIYNGLLTIQAGTKASTRHRERERERAGMQLVNVGLKVFAVAEDEDIRVTMADVVLTAALPKTSPEQGPRKITIV